MTEYIEVTDTTRLKIEQDADAECPRGDWPMLTGFVKIPGRGDSRLMDVPAVHEPPFDIADVWGSATAWEGTVERMARIFHDLHIEYDSEHGGYWFVDRDAYYEAGLLDDEWTLAKQAEIIESERETYRQWAEGEVYGVILERLSRWVRVVDGEVIDSNNPADERDEWEYVESIWGNYLDDSYTAEKVALEHFNLTDDEKEALS